MLGNINLNLLRSLHVLLEECHVSRAAERLHLTQSAVSRHLSQLRLLCKDPLLVRQGNQLYPTPVALSLKKKLDALAQEFDHLLDDTPFDPKSWKGEFVFASSDYVAQFVLPDLVSHLAAEAPNLDLAYRLWMPSDLNRLHGNGIHIASSMYPQKPQGVSSLPIGSDHSVCLMSTQHPLAGKPKLTVEDVIAYSHVQISGGGDKDSSSDRALHGLGCERHIKLRVPFFSAAIELLRRGDYLAIVPEHIAANLQTLNPLIYKPLPFDTERHQYWLMWHNKFDHDPFHRWARESIRSVLGSNRYSIR